MAHHLERRPALGYGLAVLAALGWATGGLLSKWLMTAPDPGGITAGWLVQPLGVALEPTVLAGARALASSLILGLALTIWRRKDLMLDRPARDLRFLVPFGAVGIAGVHYTYFMAISHGTVATAILLQYLAPVLTLLYAVAFRHERVRWQMPIGVALALTGAAVVVGAIGGGGLTVSPAGLTWGLLAAVWFGGYSVAGAEGGTRFHPYTLLFYSLVAAAVMWLLVIGPRAVLAPFADQQVALAVILMAVVSTIVPFGAYLMALRHISPTHAAVTAMLEPVAAGFGAWVILGEPMTTSLIVGGAVVIGAIALIQLSEDRPIVHAELPEAGDVTIADESGLTEPDRIAE